MKIDSCVNLKLRVVPERLAVCRLEPDAELPPWAMTGRFRSVSWTPAELSIVCRESSVPEGV
ncbi:MAG: ACT domain-containing protein, partial [Acidobacteriota bacterium]